MVDSAVKSGKSVRRWVSGILALAIVVGGGLGMAALARLKKPPPREAAVGFMPLVGVVSPVLTEYREKLEGYGRARAMRSANVFAEVAGVVAWIAPQLESGGRVSAGDELLRIDPRDFALAVEQAESASRQAMAELERTRADLLGLADQLKVAQASFESSQRELARAEELAKDDLATANEVDILRRAHDLQHRQVVELQSLERSTRPRVLWGEADVARLEAATKKARIDLERTQIKAPFDGRIERRTTELGQRVAPGITLFHLIDLSHVEVPVALPGSRFGEVVVGAAAEIRLREGGDVVWRGEVKRVAPAIDSMNRTFEAYLEVEGESHATSVAPGSFVVATIDGMLHREVRSVPRGAFVDGQIYLARKTADDPSLAVVEAVTPTVRRLLVDTALVDGGLSDGDLVIVTNIERVAPGSRVRLNQRNGETR